MLHSAILPYIRNILSYVPVWHWVVIGLLSMVLAFLLLSGRKFSVYGLVALGISVFVGLTMLDMTVVIRFFGSLNHSFGIRPTLYLHNLFHERGQILAEAICNILVFIPFGFFLSEFLSSTKQFSAGRRLGLATLAGFGLSLCIECLQLLLRVGFFELTDLVMNTLGAFVGAGVASLIRSFLHSLTLGRNDNKEIPSHCSE